MFRDVNPLAKDILIEALKTEVKSQGGIILSTDENEFATKLYQARVLKVGPDVTRVKVDDVVLCRFLVGCSVGYDVIMMKEEEVIGRF